MSFCDVVIEDIFVLLVLGSVVVADDDDTEFVAFVVVISIVSIFANVPNDEVESLQKLSFIFALCLHRILNYFGNKFLVKNKKEI